MPICLSINATWWMMILASWTQWDHPHRPIPAAVPTQTQTCRWHTLNRHSGLSRSWERDQRSRNSQVYCNIFQTGVLKVSWQSVVFKRVIQEKNEEVVLQATSPTNTRVNPSIQIGTDVHRSGPAHKAYHVVMCLCAVNCRIYRIYQEWLAIYFYLLCMKFSQITRAIL